MAQCLGSRFERSGALVLANCRRGGGQPRVLSGLGLGKCPTREQTLKKFFMITIIIVITSVNPKTLQNDPFILCIYIMESRVYLKTLGLLMFIL